jgi:hypothetical protein
MTFQAYLDTIKAKTGLGPDDFRRLAAEKGFLAAEVKVGTIVAWLKDEYGLGPGHAMAIVGVIGKQKNAGASADDKIATQFSGAKAAWRPAYDELLATLREVGPVDEAPTNTYISLLRGTKKFAIAAFSGDRMDVGIKLKGVPPTGRFEASGSWNAMVTHRVRITDRTQLDPELFDWLRRAYDAAA